MNIDELYSLLEWINTNVKDATIPQKYQALHSILEKNAKAATGQPAKSQQARQQDQSQQPFQKERDDLIEALRLVPLNDLSDSQIGVLRKIGIAGNIGEEGVRFIEDTLYKNALDVATASKEVKRCIDQISKGLEWAKATQAQLKNIVSREDGDEFDDAGDLAIARVMFSGAVGINNIVDLNDSSKKWRDISTAITMPYGESPENLKLLGAHKGSLLLTFAGSLSVILLLSRVCYSILNNVKEVFIIRQEYEKARRMKFSNETLESMKADVEKSEVDGIERIKQEHITELGLNENGKGDQAAHLNHAIDLLHEFMTKGGHVDFQLPQPSGNGDDQQAQQLRSQLQETFANIRLLEREPKQLEHKPSSNDSE